MGMRILALDVESKPALIWAYSIWNINAGIAQIQEPPGIISWSYRWADEPKKNNVYRWADEEGAWEELWDRLNEADAVLHFNGRSFDMPYINSEFIRHDVRGGRPYSPVRQIDLMKQIKKNTRNISNKLQWLSTDLLGFKGKVDANALTLWLQMYNGTEAQKASARKKMETYCKQDVDLLIPMMKKYLPWMDGIGANLHNGDPDSCPNCGSGKLQRRGYATSSIGKRQRWACTSCGAWLQSSRGGEFSNVRNHR